MTVEIPVAPAAPARFRDPRITAKGERRAAVALSALRTLWFNTGTLCNLTCANCYIESSPRNDALVYLSATEVASYLDEVRRDALPVEEIGFTGGEPFMNPDFLPMLSNTMGRGFRTLVLTNAMRPMMRHAAALAALNAAHPGLLTIRVSLDHHTPVLHDLERGAGTFEKTMQGLKWLAGTGFQVNVAGRAAFGHEPEAAMREGYARLFAGRGIPVDADDPVTLMLFPELDTAAEVPEITEACWGILGKSPDSVMCASSRMVVRRRGAEAPAVLACTLLAYDTQFELGATLAEANRPVSLNHPHCACFCVLGGAACSR
ncbi:radical SAM protein [Muricoccus aerilatus]|uniref:radical SAM protein n=1 Tax=Muricoccus aerilatus TaxID=452982 RepID=UPI000693F96D|nr:radical SAM protein [Roseomonas aerilata]